jgi:hypothetical protein
MRYEAAVPALVSTQKSAEIAQSVIPNFQADAWQHES